MTSVPPLPATFDDSSLLRLATTPRSRLFPVLNRASAFAPLIIVCCVLPAFQLLARPTLNEEASLWGLRSLAEANATTVVEMLEPGLNEDGRPLIFQPPLAAWLNGAVERVLGPTHPLSSSLISLLATGIAIWLATRMAWRIGGANTSLVTALLMCSHPQVLEMAITPSNSAIGFCLILACVFGMQRHLEGKVPGVSKSLLISGVTWGLSLLAIGPTALIVPLLLVCHAFNQRPGHRTPDDTSMTSSGRISSWPSLRSTLVMSGIGLALGGWWEVLMLVQYGLAFWGSWWSSLPVECLAQGNNEWHCDLRPLLQPTWYEWFSKQALLFGWLAIGLERAFTEYRNPTGELARRRYQLLIYWWLMALSGRCLASFVGTVSVANTLVWNLALLPPTVLLSAVGFGTLIERMVTRRGEFFLMVLLVTLTAWRLTMSWMTGLTCGAAASTLLVGVPILFRWLGRSATGWSEEAWRQMLQVAVYGSLLIALSAGFGLRSAPSSDAERLVELRTRLAKFPDVRRISLIAMRDPVPVTLRHLLRCRWPHVELVTSEGWDAGLTESMKNEDSAPQSRFLILEWTRRDFRLSAETGAAWQISAIGNPMRFYGRRLSFVLIGPRT